MLCHVKVISQTFHQILSKFLEVDHHQFHSAVATLLKFSSAITYIIFTFIILNIILTENYVWVVACCFLGFLAVSYSWHPLFIVKNNNSWPSLRKYERPDFREFLQDHLANFVITRHISVALSIVSILMWYSIYIHRSMNIFTL